MSSILPIGPALRVAGPYTATEGQTSFPYAFALIDPLDLLVETAPAFAPDDWSPATLGVDYNLSPAPPVVAGGNVVFLSGRGAGLRVRISGQAVIANTQDPLPGGMVDSKSLNRMFDRITIWAQEARERFASNVDYVNNLDALNVKLTGSQTVAGTKTFADARVAEPLHANSAVSKAYLDAKALNAGGGLDPATLQETYDGETDLTGITPLLLLSRLKWDGFLGVRHFGVKLNGTDETSALDNALAEAVPLLFPAVEQPLYAPLTLRPGGGILGLGEKTRFQRRFNGGQMVRHPGGVQIGDTIILRDFTITKHPSVTPVNGDHGVDIGYASPWAQRASIKNLLILEQWNGFRWRGGSEGPMEDIHVYECWSHGFIGFNPRGHLVRALSQFNGRSLAAGDGCGYVVWSDVVGETGIVFADCTSFCNHGHGYLASGTAAGANMWGWGSISSFDRLGGIRAGDIAMTQFIWRNSFIEHAGKANEFRPLFPHVSDAVGLLLETGVTVGDVSEIQSLNCTGSGAVITGVDNVSARNVRAWNNGGSGFILGTGCSLVDVSDISASFNGGTDVIFAPGITGTAANIRADEVDIPPSSTFITRDVYSSSVPVPSVAAAASISLPGRGETIFISGSGTISAIAPSWAGRKVTLIFGGPITLLDSASVSLPANFVASTGSTINLVCYAGQWFAASPGTLN